MKNGKKKPSKVAMRLAAPVKLDYKIELAEIAEMKPHPQNYHSHPDGQLEHIIESIRENGFYRNVVLARDGTILAGHGVVDASKKVGLTKIPAIRLNIDPNNPKALKVLTGDNEISKLAEIDDRALSEVLKQISENDKERGLLGTGYDKMMLAALAMVTRDRGELRDFDAATEWGWNAGICYSGEAIQTDAHSQISF